MEKKILTEETMNFTEKDYKAAVIELYRMDVSKLHQLEYDYQNWSHSSQIYALSKADGTGHPIPSNIEAYNETIVERKKIALMCKLLQKEMVVLEEFWTKKGYSLDDLKKKVQTKTLHKKQVAEKGHNNKPEETSND